MSPRRAGCCTIWGRRFTTREGGRALEEIANSFEGVQQSFALQAGREVRIIVRPEAVDDLAALQLSRNIAKKIEETMTYPGQIKVTVIRETRATEFAK